MDISNPHQLFAILHLLPSATEKEVKTAYRKLALLHHPDKGLERDAEKMKAINIAYSEIIDEKLYRSSRAGSPNDEDEPWYEFTQPWKPTPEEFQHFNEKCIAAYLERYDDDIRLSMPDFDLLSQSEVEKLRHKYKVWLNGSKKQPFEPYLSTSPSSTPQNTLIRSTATELLDDHARFVRRSSAQTYARQNNFLLEYLDVILVIFMVVMVTWAVCLSIVSPESMGVWFLCYVVIVVCAPVGWTDSIASWSGWDD